jgi:hypothetical protein
VRNSDDDDDDDNNNNNNTAVIFLDAVEVSDCDVFKDAVSATHHTALRSVVPDELGRIWKEKVVA